MKILLAALNAKYVHSNLAVHNLQVYANQQLHGQSEIEIVVGEYTINHNLDSILQSIYMERAAVIAFSCYIWNIHEILTIAKELHKVSPETRIWLGGPEVSYNSQHILEKNPHIEGIMCGEGEETFYELVKCWGLLNGLPFFSNNEENMGLGHSENEGCEYTNVAGITYRNHEGIVFKNSTRALMSMDDVPFIYENLAEFDNKILYYETSRGCPFSCSYCLSSIDKSVRFRSMELVERELQFFLDHKVSQVKFIDRTFNCKKEHALAIWRYITEHDNGITNFHFEVSADLLGNEELSLFERMRPGLIQLEIGLQSTNEETIREIRRTMDIDKLKENMLRIHSFGNIHQHLDLIAGLPYEDFVTFKKSFNEAYTMKPNQLQLGFLKVLKGSYMEQQTREYSLKYQELQPYEVLSTKWISYEELLQLKLVEEMVEVYYNSNQFEHVLSYVISFFESPYRFYEALGEYYKAHNLYGMGHKRETRYEVLRQFCLDWFEKWDEDIGGLTDCTMDDEDLRLVAQFNQKIFINLLTFDYYLRENAKSRPSWSAEEPVEKTIYHGFFKNGGTEEFSLDGEGYDSKVAARTMHIEPVRREAMPWIASGEIEEKTEIIYCLFDYEHRNPLFKDATVVFLSHL